MSSAVQRLSWRLRSVRGRLTAAAVTTVGIAVVIGAVALVLVVERSLTLSVLADLRVRADELASQLESGADPQTLVASDTEQLLLQVLDERGSLVSGNEEAGGRPLADLGDGASTVLEISDDDDVEGPFLVYAIEADLSTGEGQVIVARSLTHVRATTALVGMLLSLGVPVLLAILALTAWNLVGRALAPVDSMRREVDAISASELHRRVRKPPGDDEISRLATTMNRMLDRLDQAQQRRRQLVADTSHELRSPLATIRQHAEVAIAHPDRSELSELAETVLGEEQRLARLVDDLLILARSDEQTLNLESREVDLDDLVMDEARRLRAVDRLSVDTKRVSAGRVRGDASGLSRIVGNLGDNAARYARSRVSFSLAEVDGVVRLRVEDDGPGIPPSDRERVFERFVRLDTARSAEEGGSGLGLAIVAELVRVHGGTITVGDSPLGGARMEVLLPLPHPAEEPFSERSGSVA